jgi:hypothetical protein
MLEKKGKNEICRTAIIAAILQQKKGDIKENRVLWQGLHEVKRLATICNK